MIEVRLPTTMALTIVTLGSCGEPRQVAAVALTMRTRRSLFIVQLNGYYKLDQQFSLIQVGRVFW